MNIPYKENIDIALKQEAVKLGVSLEGSNNADGTFREAAIQARVREAKRARRERSLWIIALISALASCLSAATALYAVLHAE